MKSKLLPLPVKRPRRLRASAALRDLTATTFLRPADFIAPFFVVPGVSQVQPVTALPGVARYSVDMLMKQLERSLKLGIRAAVLFGVVPEAQKYADGSYAYDVGGPVAQALREARLNFGNELVLITDVCLCGYTDHGHCGLLRSSPRGVVIDNDSSLTALARMAVIHAAAGADMVSPSDMMDGRVAALRTALDTEGHSEVGILSYAVKYASAFYGPFREAAGSAPNRAAGSTDPYTLPPKDRNTYQMDFRNSREALREASLDETEGADMLMIKPALPYLDIIAQVREVTPLPVVAYNVSGEYAMLKAAAAVGALDEAAAVAESLTAIKRSGADLIVSYHALEALEEGWL